MKDMRTIHELLIILRDNANVTKSWFGLKQRIKSGLCNEISMLCDSDVITVVEFYMLNNYLINNKPITGGKYFYWNRYEWKPRLKWLNKHIKLTRDK